MNNDHGPDRSRTPDPSLEDIIDVGAGGGDGAHWITSAWFNRSTARAALALVAGVFLLNSPESIDSRLATVVGLGLLVVSLADLWGRFRGRETSRLTLPVALSTLVAGLILLLVTDASIPLVGFLLGALLLIRGVIAIGRSLLRDAERDRRFDLVMGILFVVLGGLTITFPHLAVITVVASIGLFWIASGAVTVAAQAQAIARGDAALADTATDSRVVVERWLTDHEMTPDERHDLIAKLYFEGADFRPRLSRFSVLMALSVAIATFGVVSDSTAVVIGAMLIAPLMTPIMALTAALTMGWSRRAFRSSLTVLIGSVGAVLLALLLTTWVPDIPGTVANEQVLSRTSPTMIDLLIALAAGAAGAFAMSRPDVADSLPGVAVAVALVPPLSVVGVSLESGMYSDAAGASLLFVTNFVAIILAGSLTFILTGFTPLFRLAEQKRQIRTSFTTVAIGMALIIVPLVATGRSIAADALARNEAEGAVDAWLTGTEFNLNELTIDGDDITVVIRGPGTPPSTDDLGNALAEATQRTVDLELRIVPQIDEHGTYEN